MITEDNLIEIKEKFELFKANFDKRYLYFLIGYFSPIIITLIVLSKFFKSIYSLFWVRLLIFIFVLIGVILHFILKYFYFRSNKNYIRFIENEIERFKKFYSSEEEFKEKMIETIKIIFNREGIEYNPNNIKKSTFYFNLHKIVQKKVV
ncbi:MAG TPA: hypothetical protein PLE45_12765 [Spirochaetota bacterium]|nr:hypothetical protein [Spirochaetota bacterium]HOL58159.1 hypothetical protein [Spirochaetota bacterium]HPP05621.1 hypothetical protein [Spirochaetota bacterium]